MNWLRKALLRWLHGPAPEVTGRIGNSQLTNLVHEDSPSVMTVTSISNGFLLCKRQYNPNGLDQIRATYAADAVALAELVTVELTVTRMTK